MQYNVASGVSSERSAAEKDLSGLGILLNYTASVLFFQAYYLSPCSVVSGLETGFVDYLGVTDSTGTLLRFHITFTCHVVTLDK